MANFSTTKTSTTHPDSLSESLGFFHRTDHLRVVPWIDPVTDQSGYDPRSGYGEQFWLPVIGPSCMWLIRNIAASLETSPSGFDLDFEKTSRRIGLGDRKSRRSPFQRTLSRLATFELAYCAEPDVLAVRRFIPVLPPRYLMRLGPDGYASHRDWVETLQDLDPEITRLKRQARRIAQGLFALGGDIASVETDLLGWPIHPALAWDAADWAWRQGVDSKALKAASR
jgi:hypothetical protein